MEQELSIGALAMRSGVAVSAIRYYEDRGLLASERSDGGQRRFHRDALRRIAFIQAAQQVGLTLNEIVDAFGDLPKHEAPSRADWKRLSRDWRSKLDEKIALLETLRNRVDGCVGCGCLSLKHCQLVNPDDYLAVRGPGPSMMKNPR